MELANILTILAIIIGPIAAVQIEKMLARNREKSNRKLSVFKTLIATRGAPLSHAHVEALNRIDLEFSDNKKHNTVIIAWKEYFDNLLQKVEDKDLSLWISKNEDLLSNLLYEMGKSLGYNFDKVLIKRNIYSPIGHATVEREQENLRKGLIEILSGENSLPITFIQDDAQIKQQVELQTIMIEYYKNRLNQD